MPAPGLTASTPVGIEKAAQYLYENGIPAYAYSTELPMEVRGAKYQWAHEAGLL